MATRREFLGVVAGAALATAAPRSPRRPNFILFLVDDLGWTDTSVAMVRGRPESRSDFYRTPALERLARQGIVFSSAYAPAPVCSPTRHSIQFGKTPARLHNTCHVRGAANCKDEKSIAQMLKEIDPAYATAHFGKWGLSQSPEPAHFGYDHSDGKTNNFHGDWRSLRDRRALPDDDPKRIFSITRRAVAFIREQAAKGRPFYLQVSHYAVHVQHAALRETIEKYRKLPRGKKCHDADYQNPPSPLNHWILEYAAMIENTDSSLGAILDCLDALGIADDTYIIFTSDNGGGFRGNEPLRGGKGECWEGGIRVPMVARGPGIQPGTYCDVPVAGWDFFPTFADLAGGGRLPPGIDGASLRPLFENRGTGTVERPHDFLLFHYPFWSPFGGKPVSAIRQGDWKLLKMWMTGETLLFNLAEDLGEKKNLASANPRKARELHEMLMTYLREVEAEDWRTVRQTQSKFAGELPIQRRLEAFVAEARKLSTDQLRKRIEELERRLAEQERIRRESVHLQSAEANRLWAHSNTECVFLRQAIAALERMLKSKRMAR